MDWCSQPREDPSDHNEPFVAAEPLLNNSISMPWNQKYIFRCFSSFKYFSEIFFYLTNCGNWMTWQKRTLIRWHFYSLHFSPLLFAWCLQKMKWRSPCNTMCIAWKPCRGKKKKTEYSRLLLFFLRDFYSNARIVHLCAENRLHWSPLDSVVGWCYARRKNVFTQMSSLREKDSIRYKYCRCRFETSHSKNQIKLRSSSLN